MKFHEALTQGSKVKRASWDMTIEAIAGSDDDTFVWSDNKKEFLLRKQDLLADDWQYIINDNEYTVVICKKLQEENLALKNEIKELRNKVIGLNSLYDKNLLELENLRWAEELIPLLDEVIKVMKEKGLLK